MKAIKEIGWAIKTLVIGLMITVKYWFKPGSEITVQYPDERLTPAPRFRGILFNDVERCTGCGICKMTCPIECIEIESYGKGKARRPIHYAINIGQCMFCGLCVESCPEGCLIHTDRYEGSVYDLKDLYYQFVTEEQKKRFMELADKGIPVKEEAK
jgi:NADH-quinone oxidoreductase subunit I